MNKRTLIKLSYILLLLSFASTSCVSVKAYEKMYLNDSDMKLSTRKVKIYQNTFHSYREGAAGANGGKVGGGCGCN